MKRFFAVLISIILVFSLSGCGDLSLTKQYEAKGGILVTNSGIGSDNVASGDNSGKEINTDVAASINLMPTIKALLKNRGYLEIVYEELNCEFSMEYLKEAIKFKESDTSSLYIEIVVKTDNQENSDKILDCALLVIDEYIEEKIHGARVETSKCK